MKFKKTILAAACAASMLIGTISPAAEINAGAPAVQAVQTAAESVETKAAEEAGEFEYFTNRLSDVEEVLGALGAGRISSTDIETPEMENRDRAAEPSGENPAEPSSEVPVEQPGETTSENPGEDPSEEPSEEPTTPPKPALDGVQKMVDWFYVCFLGRNAEPEGLEFWSSRLKDHTITGAQAATGIMFSDEGFGKNLSDSDFVAALYQAFLSREATADEVGIWTGVIERAYTRKKVVEGFLNSDEFAAKCTALGLVPGSFESAEFVDLHHEVAEFVSRLYKVCLGRRYDDGGLYAWADALVNRGATGADVVWGFLASEEYEKRGRNDSEYIEDLYNTFLGRGSDSEGKANWEKVAAMNFSRMYLAQGFVGSDEFAAFCKNAGIAVGKLVLKETRDVYSGINELINGLYKYVLKRKNKIAADDLEYWINKTLKEDNVIDVIKGFFNSSEYKDLKTSREQFVKDVYRSLLFRDPEDSALTSRVNALANGETRNEVIEAVISSQEFRNICSDKGIPLAIDGWYNGQYFVNGKKYTGWMTINGYKRYLQDGELLTDLDSVLGNTHNYVIRINRQACVLTVYAYNSSTKKYDIPCKVSLCTTGAPSTPTDSGTFYISDQYRWKELMGPCWGQWCSRFNGGELMHSVMYNVSGDNRSLGVGSYNNLGNRGSHGCCRLPASMAYWIYYHCKSGTKVIVYDSSDPGPLGKPANIYLPSWHTWDPTDPTAYKYCQERGCHNFG